MRFLRISVFYHKDLIEKVYFSLAWNLVVGQLLTILTDNRINDITY